MSGERVPVAISAGGVIASRRMAIATAAAGLHNGSFISALLQLSPVCPFVATAFGTTQPAVAALAAGTRQCAIPASLTSLPLPLLRAACALLLADLLDASRLRTPTFEPGPWTGPKTTAAGRFQDLHKDGKIVR